MPKKTAWTCKEIAVAVLVTVFVLILHGAIPFLMMPTLGQAVWSMGFSESFAKGSFFNIYAYDFGIPTPAAIAFGLAAAWPASILIRIGLAAADAYSTIFAFWFLIAACSAYLIARRFGAERSVALLGTAVWLSMPIIWGHAGYSMLSLAIALFSFYFLAVFRMFSNDPDNQKMRIIDGVFYTFAAVVSVFMDGYTFMMFAIGSTIIISYYFIVDVNRRYEIIKIIVPLHIFTFLFSYILFTLYVGVYNFDRAPIDFFRGWGLDLSFIVAPTRGVYWIFDALGLSVKRDDSVYFGDGSVWTTTFSLPVIILGLAAWWSIRHKLKIATGILLMVIFAFYMALGPSLKINSVKPQAFQISQPGQRSMPAEFSVVPTGNAWLSEKVPGFNAMRASYRWSALGIFSLWLLIILMMSRIGYEKNVLKLSILLLLILLNMPHVHTTLRNNIAYRDMFQKIDDDLVVELQKSVHQNETVAFVPWGNDFMVNYIAPKVGFRSFNIGGDKNLDAAFKNWPLEMRKSGPTIDVNNLYFIPWMLVNGITDAVVLPYFDMLRAPHQWPCGPLVEKDDVSCIQQREAELIPIIQMLRELPYLELTSTHLFSVIRLRPEFGNKSKEETLNILFEHDFQYPISMGNGNEIATLLLADGWHALEPHHVWSKERANLRLPIPDSCEHSHCEAILKFTVFGASQQHPMSVILNSLSHDWDWEQRMIAKSSSDLEVRVPLDGAEGIREISIEVPGATTPKALGLSSDSRVLGIALQNIVLDQR